MHERMVILGDLIGYVLVVKEIGCGRITKGMAVMNLDDGPIRLWDGQISGEPGGRGWYHLREPMGHRGLSDAVLTLEVWP